MDSDIETLGDALTFAQLAEANARRCEDYFHPIKSWNSLEWAGAMCGEAGEAANIAKKIKRIDTSALAIQVRDQDRRRQLLQDLGREVADTVIYADLLLQSEGMTLESFVVEAFNRKSEQIGSKIVLPSRGRR